MAEPFELVAVPQAPTRSSLHRPLAVLIAIVLVAGIAGLVVKSRDDTKVDAVALVRAASTKTATVSTMHMKMGVDLSIDGVAQPNLLSVEGDLDAARQASAITITAAGTSSEVRVVNGSSYMRVAGAVLPDGKVWVRVDPTDVGAVDQTPKSADFMQNLQFLNALVGEPREVGPDTVDGVRTTHYALTIDMTPLLDKLQQGGQQLHASTLTQGLELLRSLVDLTHIPADVWLDHDGLAREFKYSLHITAEGKTIDETADMHFSSFGVPVTVEAPPDDQVVPFSEVPDFFESLLHK